MQQPTDAFYVHGLQLSEDLQHEQQIANLTIINPFLADSDALLG